MHNNMQFSENGRTEGKEVTLETRITRENIVLCTDLFKDI